MFENFHLKINEQLALDRYTRENANEVYGVVMDNYDHLYKYSPWLDKAYSMERARAYGDLCSEHYKTGTELPLRIIYNDRYIGGTGFHAIRWDYKTTEIGYWLASEFTGQGIATTVCRALLDYGFTDLGLNRIVIKCEPGNKRSRAIPARLGFTKEGIERQGGMHHGTPVDFVVYSLLASEWKSDG